MEDLLRELDRLEQRFAADRPELEVTVRDSALGVEGYVIVWSSAPGRDGPLGACGKGGTRVAPNVTPEEIRMLAQRMALKNAAAGLAFGGAKSGLRADPFGPQIERQYRRFARLVQPLLVENGGIFGGFGFDIGARPEFPRWVCDELGSLRCFTGKPLELGGTDYDREGIAGLGVAVAAVTTARFFGESLGTLSCAIQGMGAMGAAVFRYLREEGVRVAFVSDPRLGGTVALPEDLPEALASALIDQRFEASNALLDNALLGDAVRRPLDDVLAEKVDVLIPCAVQEVIRADNVGSISARYVVEGANGPCTPDAHRALAERGIIVVPDFIANPGGIIAAYIELASEVTVEENLRTRAKVEQAKNYTREKIAANVRATLELAENGKLPVPRAGKLLALRNLYRGG